MIPQQKSDSVGDAIRRLRVDVLQCTQTRLAVMLGVTLSTVAKWESGNVQPSAMALLALARIDFEHKEEWLRRAGGPHAEVNAFVEGYRKAFSVDEEENQVIHIHGSAGAGPNRFAAETAEARISLPRNWFKRSQRIVGLYVKGDSMSPLIGNGFLVLVDINENQNLTLLDGKVVAARDDHGVCIKWLKKQGKHFYLISHNPSAEYPPIEVERKGYAIVGTVVRWIGELPHGVEETADNG